MLPDRRRRKEYIASTPGKRGHSNNGEYQEQLQGKSLDGQFKRSVQHMDTDVTRMKKRRIAWGDIVESLFFRSRQGTDIVDVDAPLFLPFTDSQSGPTVHYKRRSGNIFEIAGNSPGYGT